jgi:hypothetical protein
MRATYVDVQAPRYVSWRETDSGVFPELTFVDLGDGRTEVVTSQRGIPPHIRTPEARAGELGRAAAYIAAIASDPTRRRST